MPSCAVDRVCAQPPSDLSGLEALLPSQVLERILPTTTERPEYAIANVCYQAAGKLVAEILDYVMHRSARSLATYG